MTLCGSVLIMLGSQCRPWIPAASIRLWRMVVSA
jgi:hypothetical protein